MNFTRLTKLFYSQTRRPVFSPKTNSIMKPSPKTVSFETKNDSQIHPTLLSMISDDRLIIERKIEYLNLFLSFEQANKYGIYNATGMQIGWILEREPNLWSTIKRQLLRTHRPFVLDLIDMDGNVLLNIKRHLKIINSNVQVSVPYQEEDILAESQQRFHIWRRQYEVFTSTEESSVQFGKIDSALLSWEFAVKGYDGQPVANISRNFNGFLREILTDTGVYVIDWPSLDDQQRLALLATCISIDYDYFSRHSSNTNAVAYVD